MAESESSNSGKCPSCKNPIPPQAVFCVHCGLNFKTGQRMGTNIQTDENESPPGDRMKFSDWLVYYRKWVIIVGAVFCILLLSLLFSHRSSKLKEYEEKNSEYSKAIKTAVQMLVAPRLGEKSKQVYYELEFQDPIFPLRSPRRLEFECDAFRVTKTGAIVRGAKTLGFFDLKNSRFKLRSVIGDAWTEHSGPYEFEVRITPYSEKTMQYFGPLLSHHKLNSGSWL
jgi:hypothetical protein